VHVIEGVQPEELALGAPAAALGANDWFDALFREHYPRIVSLLTRLTGNRGQAEEIAADAFSKLARRPLLLQNDESRTAWVYRVAINAGLDAVRSNSRRRRTEEAAGAEQLRSGSGPDVLEEMLRRERCERVRGVLSTMKPRDAELLLLRSGGMAYREIAQALGVQIGSVGTLLARAEREFERRYRSRYGDDL